MRGEKTRQSFCFEGFDAGNLAFRRISLLESFKSHNSAAN